MADINAEVFNTLPETIKGDYEQHGEVYRHRSEGKLAAVKATADSLDGKVKTYEQKLRDIEAKAHEDRTKIEQEALDKARKNGDLPALEKKHQEVLADIEKRKGESDAQYEARIEKLAAQIKTSGRNSEISDVAAKLNVFEDSRSLFSKLIQDRIDIDPETGKKTYLDENGGATSMTQDEFVASLAKDAAYNRMRKANVNNGGNANGNNGNDAGGAPANPKAAEAKKSGNLQQFINESIKAPNHG